jgi:death-on-curing protein
MDLKDGFRQEFLPLLAKMAGPAIGSLGPALGRAPNRWQYDKAADLADLAAACGFGFARDHALVDGNKRMAFLAIGPFLTINGKRLRAGQGDAIRTTLNLPAVSLEEEQPTSWTRANID